MPGATFAAAREPEEQAPCDCWIPRDQRSPCDRTGFVYDERTKTSFDCPKRAAYLARRHARAFGARRPARYAGMALDRRPLDDTWLDAAIRDELREYQSNLAVHIADGTGLWLMGESEIEGVDRRKTPPVARNAVASWLAETCDTRGNGTYEFFEGQRFFHAVAEARRRGTSLAKVVRDIGLVIIANIDEILITSHPADVKYAAERVAEVADEELQFDPAILYGGAAGDFYELINTRYDDRKAFIVTSGYVEPSFIGDRVGGEVVHWLFESCKVLHLNDEPLPPSVLAPDDEDPAVEITMTAYAPADIKAARIIKAAPPVRTSRGVPPGFCH